MKKFLIALVAVFTVGSFSFATEGAAPATTTDAQKAPEVKSETTTETTKTTEAKKGGKKHKKHEKKKAEETTM